MMIHRMKAKLCGKMPDGSRRVVGTATATVDILVQPPSLDGHVALSHEVIAVDYPRLKLRYRLPWSSGHIGDLMPHSDECEHRPV